MLSLKLPVLFIYAVVSPTKEDLVILNSLLKFLSSKIYLLDGFSVSSSAIGFGIRCYLTSYLLMFLVRSSKCLRTAWKSKP